MRLAKREHAMRTMELHNRAFFQIAQPVREESFFHAIQAEVERGSGTGGVGNRVCASVDLSVRLRLLNGNELAGNERELLRALNLELEMLGLFRKINRPRQTGREQIALARNARRSCLCRGRSFGRRNCAVVAHIRLDAVEIDSRQAAANKKGRQIAALAQ